MGLKFITRFGQVDPILIAGHGDEGKLMSALFASMNDELGIDDDKEDREPEFVGAALVMRWIMERMPSIS